MEPPAPPSNIVHKYRFLDARTGRWKTTPHHMSAEAAAEFFAPGKSTHFTAERWEPIENTREERIGLPMHGKGIDCHPPKHAAKAPPSRLTVEEIRAIWERNKCEDVRRLVWEIWYLRGTVEYARYIAAWLEAADVEPPFERRFTMLQVALCSHPSPAPFEWSRTEELALKRIASTRR